MGVATKSENDFFKPRRTFNKKDLINEIINKLDLNISDSDFEKKFSESIFWNNNSEIIEVFKDEPVFDGQFSNTCYVDRMQEAFEISSSTNNMPEICGRICPQDRLCEGNCVVEQAGFGAITIGNLEKYLTEIAWEKGWVKNLSSQNQYNQKVAVIGSGPAGMAASAYLIQNGYQVDVLRKMTELVV